MSCRHLITYSIWTREGIPLSFLKEFQRTHVGVSGSSRIFFTDEIGCRHAFLRANFLRRRHKACGMSEKGHPAAQPAAPGGAAAPPAHAEGGMKPAPFPPPSPKASTAGAHAVPPSPSKASAVRRSAHLTTVRLLKAAIMSQDIFSYGAGKGNNQEWDGGKCHPPLRLT